MMIDRQVPITIITGFVGAGKTTLILNLLPQLRAIDPTYRLSFIKNEIGDLAVDTALAAAAELRSTRELLGSCICCTNVGQLGHAIEEILQDDPDRIVIETSGSAEPLKLVLEVQRLASTTGRITLDGVISVIDVLNWEGYNSTSFTAKLQAKQTDLIILNKWEEAGEVRLERVLDMLGDMDVDTPHIKSSHGHISQDLLFGIDRKLAVDGTETASTEHEITHAQHHQEELECLSITVTAPDGRPNIDMFRLNTLIWKAPRDEIYRIKAILYPREKPVTTHSNKLSNEDNQNLAWILNWSFGRFTWTPSVIDSTSMPPSRISLFLARSEAVKWKQRLESEEFLSVPNATIKVVRKL